MRINLTTLLLSGILLVAGDHAAAQSVPVSQLPLEPDMPCAAVAAPDSYEVRLSAEQEARAIDLYKRAIVITAHDHCFHPDDFKDQDRAGITVRTIKLTTDGIYWHGARRHSIEPPVEGWKERGLQTAQLVLKQVEESNGKIIVVRTVDDIRRAKRDGKLGIILSFEGGRPLAGNIENLEIFYRLGLRDLQTFWAVPSPLKTKDSTYTDFGKEVIKQMNRLGIVLDISHHRAAAFEEAMAATRQPAIVSHCAVKAVSRLEGPGGTDHLDDDGVRAIAANGGVLCLHFYKDYIRPKHVGARSSVVDFVDHVDYIRNLVGIEHVALGVDFFPEKVEGGWIQGASDMQGIINIAREMVRRGYEDEEIQKVLGGNLIRVYQQVWK